MRFGILQRYVLGEVFRAFALALLTITAVFVLLTVMAKASSIGLGPGEILKLVPYMIPGSLPYTVPVSLLFAATVVYGRLASDNEVIAVKTAGLSAMVLLWPSFVLAFFLSVVLSILSLTLIPTANNMARVVVFDNVEDFFYKKLKMFRVFDVGNWPFLIKVQDVEGRIMKNAIFKQRAQKTAPPSNLPRAPDAEDPAAWDMIIYAKRARIEFDFEKKQARVYFYDANIRQANVAHNEGTLKETMVVLDIPANGLFMTAKMTEEMTLEEILAKQADNREKISLERKRQAVAVAWYLGSGRPAKVDWPQLRLAFADFDHWNGEIKKYDTEIHFRLAMAWGSLFFMVLGAPVGILFARRDFLSAFITCFMPIVIVYYPLVLFGVNLGKEGYVPSFAVWGGNVVLGLAAGFWAFKPVMKH